VTVHWMDPAVDAGPVAYEAWFDLTDSDTGLSVSARCVREGVPLIERLLETAAADPAAIPARPQDLSRRRYYRRDDVPDDGRISWSRPARRIVDLVRACDYFPFPSPWGTPTARLGDDVLRVLKASRTGEAAAERPGTIGEPAGGGIAVAADDEWVLVERVRANGRPQPAADVLTPGLRLADG
jgi:methionyl-tRNA formyltransferase